MPGSERRTHGLIFKPTLECNACLLPVRVKGNTFGLSVQKTDAWIIPETSDPAPHAVVAPVDEEIGKPEQPIPAPAVPEAAAALRPEETQGMRLEQSTRCVCVCLLDLPPPARLKFRSFFPLRTISLFFSLLGVFSLNCGRGPRPCTTQSVCLGSLGSFCETPTACRPPGLAKFWAPHPSGPHPSGPHLSGPPRIVKPLKH